MRQFLTTLCLIFLIPFLPACNKSVDRPIQLGTVQWPGYEPLYLARSLGYLHESHVHLIEQTATTETIEAYRNEVIDIAALTLDEVLLLKQQGQEMEIILVMDISNGADVVIARPGIKTIADLKGKRIGVEANALGAYMFSRSLEHGRLKPADVQIVSLQYGEHESAFIQGKVDAVVTFEPVKTKLLNQGGKVVFDSSKIPNEIVDVLIVRPAYLQAHRDEVRLLVTAWFKALSYLNEHREDAARQIAGRLGIKPSEFLTSLEGLKIADLAFNERMLGGSTPELQANLQRLSRVMLDNKLLLNAVDTRNLLNASVLH
jgi:NitT/TauT family transport system substrate-binding protein